MRGSIKILQLCIILLFSHGIRAGGLCFVVFVLLAGSHWPAAAAGVKSFKDLCLKYFNVHPVLLISVLSTAFSLMSIVYCCLSPPSASGHLPAAVHHYLKLPTLFLTIQQCEPLFTISAPLSAVFRHRRPPAAVD